MKFPWWWPESFHRQWFKTRGLGLRHFVWLNGLLMFGGGIFLVALLVPSLFGESAISIESVGRSIVMSVILGPLWALVTWWLNERLFAKFSRGAA